MVAPPGRCRRRAAALIRRHITALRLALAAADGLTAMALFIGLSIVRFGSRRLARRVGVRRDRPVRGRCGLRPRSRRRRCGSRASTGSGRAVDPARGHRRPGRDPAPRGRRLHHALPAQAAERQPALPAAAVLVPGRPDARLADRRSGPSSSGCGRAATTPATCSSSAPTRRPRSSPTRSRGTSSWGCDRSATWPRRTTRGDSGASACPRPVLGTVDEIEDVLHGTVVDEVAICLGGSRTGRWSSRSRDCARTRAGSSASPSPRRP